MLYGILEQEGLPTEVRGLGAIDADQAVRRLEDMIRSAIRPRIPGVTLFSTQLGDDNLVIIVHIPRSWASPHRVVLEGHDKFYTRTSAGKHPLDVDELRAELSRGGAQIDMAPADFGLGIPPWPLR